MGFVLGKGADDVLLERSSTIDGEEENKKKRCGICCGALYLIGGYIFIHMAESTNCECVRVFVWEKTAEVYIFYLISRHQMVDGHTCLRTIVFEDKIYVA